MSDDTSNAKFWRVVEDNDQMYGRIKVMEGHSVVCQFWLDDAPVHDYNSMQRVRARKIAAVPVMLEALEAMLDFIEGKPDAVNPFEIVRNALYLALGTSKASHE